MELVIKKKDIIKLGKDLIKEVYEFLNNKYFKETFPEEINKTAKTFNNYLVQRVFGNHDRSIESDIYGESTYEEDLESVIKMIKDERLDIEIVYETLKNLDLDMEIHEDLYFKNGSFLNLYSVFDIDYTYLQD